MGKAFESRIRELEESGSTVPPAGEQLLLDLGGFEGPIDVLLVLARDQKVDLTQISILDLADQYLDWVARLRKANLELAADYLVMAAWLAYMKSKLLLPDFSEDEEATGEELAAALQFQMLRLEGMQEAGAMLFARDQLDQDYFARGEPEKFGYSADARFDVGIYDLLSAYGEHSHRSNISVLHIQPSDLYSPDDAIKWFKNLISSALDWTRLSQFLPDEFKGDVVSRSMLASGLAAALQLTKEGQLELRQTEEFGTVFVRATKIRPETSVGVDA